MEISNRYTYRNNINFKGFSNITKPILSAAPKAVDVKAVLGLSTATLSGTYLVNQSLKNQESSNNSFRLKKVSPDEQKNIDKFVEQVSLSDSKLNKDTLKTVVNNLVGSYKNIYKNLIVKFLDEKNKDNIKIIGSSICVDDKNSKFKKYSLLTYIKPDNKFVTYTTLIDSDNFILDKNTKTDSIIRDAKSAIVSNFKMDGALVQRKNSKEIVDNLGKKHNLYITEFYDPNLNVLRLDKSGKVKESPYRLFKKEITNDGKLICENYKYSKGFDIISIERNQYSDKNADKLETLTTITKKYLLDKKHNISSGILENTTVKSMDYRTNALSETVFNGNGELVKKTIQYFSLKTGKPIRTEIIQKSDIDGVLNSKIIYANGNEKIESIGKTNSDGSINVEKHFESLDGTKTNYFYMKNSNGNINMDYEIKSSSDETLAHVYKSFKKISDNKTLTEINGTKYETDFSDKLIFINNKDTDERKIVSYIDILENVNKENKEFIKKLPADLILALANNFTKIVIGDEDGSNFFSPSKNQIHLDKKTVRISSLSHEVGHLLDYTLKHNKSYDIAKDLNVRKVYDEEKTAFLKIFPDAAEETNIQYFIQDIEHYSGLYGGTKETVAETNSLLSLVIDDKNPKLTARFHFLQKYFPRTVAEVSKYLVK